MFKDSMEMQKRMFSKGSYIWMFGTLLVKLFSEELEGIALWEEVSLGIGLSFQKHKIGPGHLVCLLSPSCPSTLPLSLPPTCPPSLQLIDKM